MFGQEFPAVQWIAEDSEELYSIQPDSTLCTWYQNGWKVRDTLRFEGVDWLDFEGVEKIERVYGGSEKYFVGVGSQQVYVLHSETSTFERVDRTYYKGYNFQAINWIKNDTLFSLGGYGFWHTHAVLSYYHLETKEWHVLETNEGPGHVTDDFYQWDSKGNLWVSWMKTIHGSDVNRITDIWKLDVNSRQWYRVGTLSDEVVNALENNPGILLPIGYYTYGENRQLIDLVENRIDHIDVSVVDVRVNPGPVRFSGTGAFVGPNALLNYYVPNTSNLKESVGFRYTFHNIQNARRNPEAVYVTGLPWWYYLVALVLLLGVVYVLVKLARKLKQPFRKGTTMDAEEAFFRSLEPLEVKLLRALLRAEMRSEGLKSGPITEIMGWTDKSWDNQRKWRNNLIKELNARALNHLNIEELIYRERDPNDKRERVYRLEGNGFRLLRDSLHFTQ